MTDQKKQTNTDTTAERSPVNDSASATEALREKLTDAHTRDRPGLSSAVVLGPIHLPKSSARPALAASSVVSQARRCTKPSRARKPRKPTLSWRMH